MYDNITAGIFDCEQTIDRAGANGPDLYMDDFAREDDSGWYAMQWHVEDQWLEYDFGYVTPIGQVCIRWDDFKNITYGAESIRVDTSLAGR